MPTRALTLGLAILLTGCIGNARSRSEPSVDFVSTQDTKPATTNDCPLAVLLQVAQRISERRLEDQTNARKLYESAIAHLHKAEFQAALNDLEKARRLDPASNEIRELYNEVCRSLTSRPEEWGSFPPITYELGARIEQTRIEVEDHLQEGKRHMSADEFKEAEGEFDAIVQKLKWIPYDIGLNEPFEEAKKLLRSCRIRRLMKETK